MVVGVLQFELLIPWAESLKDKRSVVRSLKDRLHRQHLVSVAEVSHQDILNVAVLGVAVVCETGARAASVLDRIENKLRGLTDAELGETHREILTGQTGAMGHGSDADTIIEPKDAMNPADWGGTISDAEFIRLEREAERESDRTDPRGRRA
ncbi:MAG: hypothetical protein DHS20C14_20220 [Phycisphaeraceae bacterium]|nr:MAG: hypothetical protein DHS20C14_20220 [Phycisphaeraceae bacterium]